MTSRQPDSEIPGDELLYRSIAPAALVDGDRVSAHAVELPRMSVNRSRYSQPTEVLRSSRPGDTRVARIRAADLPDPQRSPDAGHEVWYRFSAEDDPCPPEDPNNEAHAEVRLRRSTDGAVHKPGSKAFREALRRALADRMRVLPF